MVRTVESFIAQRPASASRHDSAVAEPLDQQYSITSCSNWPRFFGCFLFTLFMVTLHCVTYRGGLGQEKNDLPSGRLKLSGGLIQKCRKSNEEQSGSPPLRR